MNCSKPGFPVLHYFPELAQTDIHWVSDAIPISILCCPLLFPSIFPSIGGFFNESVLHIKWSKYLRFSFIINSSNEYSRLISFRIDVYDLFYPKVTQESSLVSQFKNISYLMFSLLYGPTVTSIQDHQKNHSFDYTDLFWQSDVFAFQELILLPVVLDKTLKSPLDCKEIKLCNSKGNQSWVFTGSTDAEAPILWPPDAKNWLI